MNRKRWIVGLVALVPLVGAMTGCQQKKRLTQDTFVFRISPPAANVARNGTVTLIASGNSGAGTVPVNPTWTFTPASAGSLNTQIGTNVQFQAGANLGNATVTAIWEDSQATCQLAIVTDVTSTGALFWIVRDIGLPTGADVESDIFTSVSPFDVNLSTRSGGYTPEGLIFHHAENAEQDAFWGVTLDKHNTGLRKNLMSPTDFTGGRLRFSIRLGRTLGLSEVLRFTIEDSGGQHLYTLAPGANGFSGQTTDWQDITLPLALFGAVDLTTIKVPFAIALPGITSPLTFDVDAVRWEN